MNQKIYCLSILLSVFFSCKVRSQNDSVRFKIHVGKSETWWAGIVNHGNMMPVTAGYSASLINNIYGNQAQPLLISNKGNVVWSNEPFTISANGQSITLTKPSGDFISSNGGSTLKDAYMYASRKFFPPSGTAPDLFLFTNPQYNTWIELLYNQNQHDIIKYAKGVIDNGFPPGVIMIDDNWQEAYGTWRFHPARFPDPKLMMDSLHAWGFKVMLWTCPFISGDTEVFRKLYQQGLLLNGANGYPKMVRWWNGSSAVLDFTNPDAVLWYNVQLKWLYSELGVDGFKFDAGDPEYYIDTHGKDEILPNDHTELFAKIGIAYPFNEYRATWKMGGQPLAQRLRDKGHNWNDLKLLIPDILLSGIIGYPFTCPDMIGGGEMGSFINLKNVDQDLIVRSAQCHALMPMMQFSAAPWRILDKEHLSAVQQAIQLRSKHIELISQLVDHAAKTGEPIVRMMDYEFPGQGFDSVADQFMLGGQILVAPILDQSNQRTVVIPPGKWIDMRTGKTVVGPKSLKISAQLNELPHFIKRKS